MLVHDPVCDMGVDCTCGATEIEERLGLTQRRHVDDPSWWRCFDRSAPHLGQGCVCRKDMANIPRWTLEQGRLWVASTRWTEAKTMRQWPHEYAIRNRQNASHEFTAFAALIVREGEVRPWPAARPKSRLRYLDLDGMTYWTMGWPPRATTVINRKVEGTSL